MKPSTSKKIGGIFLVLMMVALLVVPANTLAAPKAEQSVLGVAYRGHVQNQGDMPKPVGTMVEGPDPLGTRGQSLRVEGFWIELTGDLPKDAGINYEVHVQNKGWMEAVSDGVFAGTSGQSLRVEAVRISLVNLPNYDVYYRGHVENSGDIPQIDDNWAWVKNGEELGTTGSSFRLEELQVKLVKRVVNGGINYVLAGDSDFSGDANGDFKYVGNDEYVEIPHTIKGIPLTSYTQMFENTSVKGVKSDNKKITDMSYMFNDSDSPPSKPEPGPTDRINLNKARSLDLSELDTSSVTNMQGMFFNNQATALDLSHFDTSNVTNMWAMFSGSQATALDLRSFNTSQVTNMNSMFAGSQAAALDLSHFDTSNVTDMKWMFNASQATALDLSHFDTSNVTNMWAMFSRSQATSFDLSSFDMSNVSNMADMFRESQARTGYARTEADADQLNASSNKPAGLTFTVPVINIAAIEGVTDPVTGETPATEITETDQYTGTITWSPADTPFAVNTEYRATINLTAKAGYSLTGVAADFFTVSGATASNDENSGVVTAVFPQTVYYQAQDSDFSGEADGEFRYTGTAKYVIMPPVIKGVAVTSYANMFEHTSVRGVKSDNKNITDMSYMFKDNQATSLDLSHFDTSNVTNMKSMFHLSHATLLDLSSFDTANVTDMAYMFSSCQATSGYAQTAADANRFNESSHKPASLTFTVPAP